MRVVETSKIGVSHNEDLIPTRMFLPGIVITLRGDNLIAAL